MELGGRLDKMGSAIEDVTEWEHRVEESQDTFQKISEVIKVTLLVFKGFEIHVHIGGDGAVPALQGGGFQADHRGVPRGAHPDPVGHGLPLGGIPSRDQAHCLRFV